MKAKAKKMIAPIVVTLILVLYYLFFFAYLYEQCSGVPLILLGVIPLVLSVGMILVCIERIKEIKKGEEDDLSQY